MINNVNRKPNISVRLVLVTVYLSLSPEVGNTRLSATRCVAACAVADPLGDFLNLMQLLMGVQYATMSPASLVKEAAQGHVDNVRRILSQHPSQVDDLLHCKLLQSINQSINLLKYTHQTCMHQYR